MRRQSFKYFHLQSYDAITWYDNLYPLTEFFFINLVMKMKKVRACVLFCSQNSYGDPRDIE